MTGFTEGIVAIITAAYASRVAPIRCCRQDAKQAATATYVVGTAKSPSAPMTQEKTLYPNIPSAPMTQEKTPY